LSSILHGKDSKTSLIPNAERFKILNVDLKNLIEIPEQSLGKAANIVAVDSSSEKQSWPASIEREGLELNHDLL